MKLPARVQRLDEPTPGALVLELYAARERAYLSLSPGATPALLEERPRGDSPSPRVQQLRRHLLGAALLRLSLGPHSLALQLEGQAPFTLLLDRREGTALLREGRTILGSRRASAPAGDAARHLDDLSPLRAERAVHPGTSRVEALRARRSRDKARELERARRKLKAISADGARAEDAPALREEAALLLAHRAELRRGEPSITLQGPEGGPRVIPLDPRRTPQEEIESRFLKARKLERGAAIAEARAAEVRVLVEALERELTALETASEAELEAGATSATSDTSALKEPRRGPRPRLPYRRFSSREGGEILVGRSAADNDALTLHVARPGDVFLHARGVPGSHVIARAQLASIPEESLLDAATLAAHFSSVAGEDTAEVQYTERRHVRKAKGMPKGAVRVERERTLLLRVDPSRIARLLASEERNV